jgi:ADP-ribosyltransferase exoenzyme
MTDGSGPFGGGQKPFLPLGQEGADLVDTTRSWVDPNGYRLSDRLWLAKQADRDQIDGILKNSVVKGLDPIQTAKTLTGFLTPQGLKQTTMTPRGGVGNYAARRLTRTETNRAFNEGRRQAATLNPFVYGVKWNLSNVYVEADDHGICQEKADRSSRNFPPGVYETDAAPIMPAHPNCRCHWSQETVSDDDAKTILQTVLAGETPPTSPLVDEFGRLVAPIQQDLVESLFNELFGPAKGAAVPAPIELQPSANRVDIGTFDRSEADVLESALESTGFVDQPYRGKVPEWTYGGMEGNKYTAEEAAALRDYKASWYGQLNKYLRAGQDYKASRITAPIERVNGLRDDIDAAFAKAEPLTQPIRVSRGSFTDFIDVENQVPGNIFVDDGYSSTSAKVEGVGFGRELRMDIYVPEGVRVLAMDAMEVQRGSLLGEVEVLLPRGTSFLIREVDTAMHRVIVEVIP